MAIFGTTLGKCLKLVRADSVTLADTGFTAAELDPTVAVPVLAAMAVAVPTCQAVLRWFKQPDRDKIGLNSSLESIPDEASNPTTSIFEVLAAARDNPATGVLDTELADIMDEPDWEKVNRRLDDAVMRWSRERPEGAGNPPDHETMVQVLLSLIRNLREAAYRELFADHYRQLVSVDRRARSRVDEIYIQLRAEHQEDATTEPDETSSDQPVEVVRPTEYLDFRGSSPGDVSTALRQSGNLIILGEPGAGKSTLLRYLAASCAERESANALLPIFLRLRDYAENQEMLIAESAVTFSEGALQLKMDEGFFEDALTSGRCVVFLDALDEVPAEERRSVVDRVEQLTSRYPDNRFIVSSRLAAYDEEPLDPSIFTRYVVQPMDDDGIAAFIDARFANDAGRAQKLRNILDGNHAIRSLAANPLLMTILSLIYRESDAGLQLNRAHFYQRAVAILVEDTDDEGRSIQADGRQTHEMLLTAVARLLHDENKESIERYELEERAADFLLEYRGKGDAPTRADEDQAFEEAEAFIERAQRAPGCWSNNLLEATSTDSSMPPSGSTSPRRIFMTGTATFADTMRNAG